MDLVNKRETTEKVEHCAKFLEELSFQRAISKFASEQGVPLNLVLNLDQNLLFYASPGK